MIYNINERSNMGTLLFVRIKLGDIFIISHIIAFIMGIWLGIIIFCIVELILKKK